MPVADRLTDRAVRAAKPRASLYKLTDGRGMYLAVSPTGAKSWRLKFRRLDGREATITVGLYPDVPLALARERRDEARRQIAAGVDPVEHRREVRAAAREARRDTFGAVAESYFRKKSPAWSANHCRDVRAMLDRELIPCLGTLPMIAVKPADVRKMLEAIEARGAFTFARDCRTYTGAVFRHFNSERAAPIPDPSTFVTLTAAPPVKHHAALPLSAVGEFLRKLQHSPAGPLLRIATRLLLHTAVRTTELREATWAEIDEPNRVWRIGAERMKSRQPHTVPLSSEVLALLRELRTISGSRPLLLPHQFDDGKTISENSILAVIKGVGFGGRLTGHGMRTLFSNWANELGKFTPDAVERQLAHSPRDKVRGAYLSAEFLAERTAMMGAWSAWLTAEEARATAAAAAPIAQAA